MRDDKHLNNGKLAAFLAQQAARFFPMLGDMSWEYSYGGCIAVTRDLAPQVGRIAPGVFYAHGYCGNGIATTHTVGKVLRDLILEADTLYSKLFFVRDLRPTLPPEPFAFLGARAMSLVLATQDRNPVLVPWPKL